MPTEFSIFLFQEQSCLQNTWICIQVWWGGGFNVRNVLCYFLAKKKFAKKDDKYVSNGAKSNSSYCICDMIKNNRNISSSRIEV